MTENEQKDAESKNWGRALASIVLSVELERNREKIRQEYKPSNDWKDDPRDRLMKPILEQLSEKYKDVLDSEALETSAASLKYTHPVWEGLQ
jgi:hypothetical protein